MSANPFNGRSLITISDFTSDELLYIFGLIKELKRALQENQLDVLKKFAVDNQSVDAYTIFTENSTRTLQSFLKALDFHQSKNSLFRLNPFRADASSFAKSESWQDTINTLVGYTESYMRSLFIIRSKLEGVCRWLQYSSAQYAKRHGLVAPVFINAGDGKHEHPTQELLDLFTFLEDNNWSHQRLHLALVGDLLHGRTVHSKANGLKIFENVIVDLVAPPEVQLPQHYVEQMRANGYQVNVFDSIDAYLLSEPYKIADKWYLTRPQLERLDPSLIPVIGRIRSKIVFTKSHLEYIQRLKINLKLYHPFPRYKENPALPRWLDDLFPNAYERQSQNGYYTRVVLIALLLGKLGDDFDGQVKTEPRFSENFIREIDIVHKPKKAINEGINPIKNGVVIDHISRGEPAKVVSKQVIKIREILGINQHWYAGVAQSRQEHVNKGLIFLPGFEITESQIKILAAIDPQATLNIIRGGKVVKKLAFELPERIYNIKQAACINPDCVSHPSHHEGVMSDFSKAGNGNPEYICRYCGQPHSYKEIWRV